MKKGADVDAGAIGSRYGVMGGVDVGDSLIGICEVPLEPLSLHKSGVLDGWYHVVDPSYLSSRIGQVRVAVDVGGGG